jgi:hypothetical protein
VVVIVRKGVCDVSVEETEGRGEGFANSFRVRAEAGNKITLCIVDGDQSAIDDVVLAFEGSHMEVMVLEIGLSTGKGHQAYIGAGEVGVIR